MTYKYSLISLFAGVSGSSLGFKNTGRIKEHLAIDCDPYVEKCFKLNFPDIPLCNRPLDKSFSAQDILNIANLKKGELEILFASPPCQGFSMAKGSRNLLDVRNDLFLDTINYINDISPLVFIIENVKGLISGSMKLRFNQIIDKIENIPYEYRYKILNAADYGVPQLRERIFIIGVRKDILRNGIKPTFPLPTKRDINNLAIKNYAFDIDFFTSGQFANNIFTNNEVCRTITATASMKFFKDGISRKPTISEVKKLCSFPEEFKLWSNKEGINPKTKSEYSYNKQYRAIGNSVPPRLMQAVAETVIGEILDPYYSTFKI
jgi:site-specific DNA-cytosine methylase